MFRGSKRVEKRKETREQIIALLRALPNDVARAEVLAAACTALRIMQRTNRMFDALLEGERVRNRQYASREQQIILGRKS